MTIFRESTIKSKKVVIDDCSFYQQFEPSLANWLCRFYWKGHFILLPKFEVYLVYKL